MSQVIVTSPEQLQTLIAAAVQGAIANMPAPDEKTWGWNECAEHLNVGLNVLRSLVDADQIPYFEIPSSGTGQKRMIRFHPHEIRSWRPNAAKLNVRQDRAAEFHTAKNSNQW